MPRLSPRLQVEELESRLVPSSTLANIHFTSGWATFGQVLPQGAAWNGLQVGTLPTQTDIKNVWPDGSIKFAVVSANIPATAMYPLHEAAPLTGSFVPTIPNTAVTFTIGGTRYVASPPAMPTADLWLSGPLVIESRAVVSPVGPQGQPHPFLDVVFDVRSYANGQNRVDVTVENDLDIAVATTVTYNVAITINGRTRFQQNDVTHYYLTRWREVFTVGLSPAAVRLDLNAFYQAGALPQYLSSAIANVVDTMDNTPPSAYPWATQPRFNILQGGDLDYYMPDHGGRPEVGPYPGWVATYLAHQNYRELPYLLKNGDLAGSWPVHVQEPDAAGNPSGALVSIDQRPDYWLDPRAAAGDKPAGTPLPDPQYFNFGPTDPAVQSPLVPDNAHVPSLAYVPYLFTGDRYYADEMQYWADYGLIKTWPQGGRDGSAGLLAGNEVRGYGWVLRNLTDAAAYLPDSDPYKAYFAQKVENNLQWLDTWAANNTGPLGVAWIRPSSFEGDPQNQQVWMKVWMYEYLAWAIGHAHQAGYAGGDAWLTPFLTFEVSLYTSPDWNPANGAPYAMAVGVNNADGSITDYTSLAEVYANTFANADATAPLDYYGPITRTMLEMAASDHLSGAPAALSYLDPLVIPDLGKQPEYALR